MYKNGSLKIELSSPALTVGNPLQNAYNIASVLNQSKASFVLFPELCLSSYTAGDLFFETTFLEQNFQALKWLLNNNTFEGVYILGMPLALHEVLFNTAVVIQQGKILGIVPKQTIPNYKEFSEKRWFQSGKTCASQLINILGQKVLFGNILFINKQHDIIFGVEICQDLWTVFSPSDLLSLNGAHLIFNLSSSTEHVGKINPRKNAVLDHSRKQIGGYFYTSSGTTESTVDNLFSNHKIAAVLGELLGEKDLFNDDISLVVDVCVDSIKFQRRIDTTYGDQRIGQAYPFEKAFFNIQESSDYQFESIINQTPFIPTNNLIDTLKLVNRIQALALKTKLSNLDVKVILELTSNMNDFLTLIVVLQAFAFLRKSLNNLIIILKPHSFENKFHYHLLREFCQNQGINYLFESSFLKKKHLLSFLDLPEEIILDTISDENAPSKHFHQIFLKALASQTQKVLLLESNNFSDIALGKMKSPSHYDHIYNVNVGLPNTLVKELLLYYLQQDHWKISTALKELYIAKTEETITSQIIIEDFILYYHIKKGFTPNKIAWFLQKSFGFSKEKNLELVCNYLKVFYQSQFKRQHMPPGPKLLENSLSPRGEFRLPIDLQRQE